MTTTTTTMTPPPPPAPAPAALTVTVTSDPGSVTGLKAQGRFVALYVGLTPRIDAVPDIIVFGPRSTVLNMQDWRKFAPVIRSLKAQYPGVPLGWEGSAEQHPSTFNLFNHKILTPGDYWFFDCAGYTENRVAAEVSKMVHEYSERQKLGFKLVVVNTPFGATAIKAGATGVVTE